jgi:signal transduction histidine kinase/ActR/RegA family two-component response regulator
VDYTLRVGFFDWWVPTEHRRGSLQWWRSRLLVQLLSLATVMAVALTTMYLLTGDVLSAAQCAVVGLAMPAAGAALRYRGAYRVAVHGALTVTTIGFGVFPMLEAQLDGAALAALGVVPFMGVILLGPRSLWVWAPASLTMILAIYVRPELGMPLVTLSPVVTLFRALALVIVVLGVALAFARARDDSMEGRRRTSAAKSRFLANLSDALRTPMNGVLGTTEVLLRQATNPESRERLGVISRSGRAMVTLIDDILDISKIEAGSLHLELRDFDPRELARDVTALYRASAELKGLALDVTIAEHTPRWVRGAADRLRQVLANLLSNAIKFTERGRVSLAIEPHEEVSGRRVLLFAVTDSGMGIGPEVRPRLFQPFSQADHGTARRFGGTGLGLALCRELVVLMGGVLQVTSRPEEGSRFYFDVPVFPAVAPPPAAAAVVAAVSSASLSTPRAAPLSAAPRAGEAVLVVDDNPINLKVACAMLRLVGRATRTATNGEEAIAEVTREPPSVILMDCHMPVVDGLEATRRIRALPGAAGETPIIALTAAGQPDELAACLKVGMNGTLTKPLSLDTLRRVLAAHVRPPPGAALDASEPDPKGTA